MSDPIRVLYFMPTFVTGGAERLVSDLVRHLDPGRFKASVCVFENGHLGYDLERRGYAVHQLAQAGDAETAGRLGRIATMRYRVGRLRTLMARERTEVLHTHFLAPALHAFLSRPARRSWQWVHTEHVRPDLMVPEYYSSWLVRLAPWLLSRADCVTGVAPGVGEYLRRTARVPHPRVRVIPNGIDVDHFARGYNGRAVRAAVGIPDDAWVVGTVANLRPQKNHRLLLDSFRSVLHDAPDAWLMLAGDGELRAPLEAQARDLGIEKHVTFLGARLDVAELFAAMDVYCLPSHFEGMPLSLFEAMAARRPIVATSVVGIRDLLVDGVNGLLVPPDDAAALARTLLRLRREPELAAALVESGWRQVDRQARLGTMFEAYGHLYESLSRRTGTETL